MMQASDESLVQAWNQYDEALEKKSAALPQLDRWYRIELPELILQRRHANDRCAGFVTQEELVQLMKWKLTRGKFRPRLQQLAASNADENVRRMTGEAFALLAQSPVEEPREDDCKAAIEILNQLKGVGPATASALVALLYPKSIPFMSDEILLYGTGLKDKPKYTTKEWIQLVKDIRKRVSSLPKDKQFHCLRSAEAIEKAAWALAVLNRELTSASSTAKSPSDKQKHPASKAHTSPSSKRRRRD